MWKKHLERDDSVIVGEEGYGLGFLRGINSFGRTHILSALSSDRPVLRPAAELAPLLGLLALLQHIRCVLRPVAAHPQTELWGGGHTAGVSGPVLPGGKTGQGKLASKLMPTHDETYLRCTPDEDKPELFCFCFLQLCARCNRRTECTKRLSIHRFPQVLVIRILGNDTSC